MSKKIFFMIALALLVLSLASCTPAATPVPEEPASQATAADAVVTEEAAEPAEEPTAALAPDEPVELTFWFEGAVLGTLDIFQQSFDRFEEMHPNVTIEAVPIPFEDMLRTMTLALDAETGPDIATVPPLDSITFRAAEAGHLLDLSQIGEERGWFENFDMQAIAVNNAGLGGIYGIPYEWTIVGVYYNKEIFAELGLEPPQSFEEFEGQLATIKEAGITPISVGGRDGWPLDHVWQQMIHTNVDYSVLRALEDKDPSATYEHPALIDTAHKVKEWTDKGYLDPNMLSTSFVDANNLFINGEVAMNVGGTWVQADFRGAPFEVGFFAMPRMRTDIEAHMGGFTPYNDFVIVKESANRDWAIELLDYMLSEENLKFLWENGLLVPYEFAAQPDPIDSLQVDIYNSTTGYGPGHFITVSAPETSRVLWANLQEIVAGSMTPEEAFAQIQETYVEEIQ